MEFIDFELLQVPEVRLTYETKKEFENIARKIGIMQDLKAGVPRMGYYGVVTALYNHKRGISNEINKQINEID